MENEAFNQLLAYIIIGYVVLKICGVTFTEKGREKKELKRKLKSEDPKWVKTRIFPVEYTAKVPGGKLIRTGSLMFKNTVFIPDQKITKEDD